MKLTDIFEAEVTSITQANTQNRTYGADAKSALQDFHDSTRQTVQGIQSPPQIKPAKRFNPAAVKAAILAAGFPATDMGDYFTVQSGYNESPPCLYISVNPKELPQLKDVPEQMANNWLKNWYLRLAKALAQVFGTFASHVETMGFGGLQVFLSQEYFTASGAKSTFSTANAPAKVAEVFKKQNVGGIIAIEPTKTKSGYTIKVLGAELVDQRSQKTIDMALRQAFGDDYISMKDAGLQDELNNRELGSNRTHYYLYFKPDLKKTHTLTQ